MRFRWFPHEI